jgi:L-ascorbate metabolism protein UlaG (beta-lactamase superfamily)
LAVGGGLTMGADDAIKAARFVDVKIVVGVHYDTFGFIKIDRQKAIQLFYNSGLTLHLLDIGN